MQKGRGNKIKIIVLNSWIICFAFAADTSNGAINITSESKVEMYTALFGGACNEAKTLLQSRGIEFESHMVTFSRKTTAEMKKRTCGKTFVPQIMVDDHYFGGLAELIVYFKDKSNME